VTSSAIEYALSKHGSFTDVEFSKCDLDKPLPGTLATNGEQGSLDKLQQFGSGETLRQLIADGGTARRSNWSGRLILSGGQQNFGVI
jgi:hypothetical protein